MSELVVWEVVVAESQFPVGNAALSVLSNTNILMSPGKGLI